MATLQQTLDLLVIPAAFARHERVTDTTVLTELDKWKSNTELSLKQLDSFGGSARSISELAGLVRVLAPLTATAQWSSPAIRSLATAHLSRIPASDRLVEHILTQVVKPFFVPTPHPALHTSTARILPRPADVQDTYIEQPWKEHPGLDEIVRWCLLHTESSTYENAWPLFLPPVMSFLDDYQARYKLLGIRLVSDTLARVPPQLLLRTGVDTLIFNSLINSLSHLRDPSTPDLICSAVTTTLQLVDLTTPSVLPSHDTLALSHDNKSEDMPAPELTCTLSPTQSKSLATRFSRLSTLLSSSLLGTVIMYTPAFLPSTSSSAPGPDPFADSGYVDVSDTPLQSPTPQNRSFNPTLVAAAQSLTPILSALGIGGARFLKGVIPVLAEWLALPLPIVPVEAGYDHEETPHDVPKSSAADVTLHLATLSSLSVLFHTCTPQIEGWSMTIVDAIGQCWVRCLDTESQKNTISNDSLCILRTQLKAVAVQLSQVYPEVIKNEYATLLAVSRTLFEGLVEEI